MFVRCIRYRTGVCSRIRGNPVVHETVISLCEIIYRQISDMECIECSSMQAADNNEAQIPVATPYLIGLNERGLGNIIVYPLGFQKFLA